MKGRKIMGKKDLINLKKIGISNLSDPVDISTMNIRQDKPQTEKAAEFFLYVNNPYFFKVGDITVRINFKGSKTFSEALVNAVNSA